jgi:hypothetical protein
MPFDGANFARKQTLFSCIKGWLFPLQEGREQTSVEILERARALIERPENWLQGGIMHQPPPSRNGPDPGLMTIYPAGNRAPELVR